MLFEINIFTVFTMALLGGIGAYMSNQGIAVFHDGIRPLFPQYTTGAMDRKSLFSSSFAISFGLILGFGVPISIVGGIMIANTIMLVSDIIGIYFPDDKRGKWLATIIGGIFAVFLLFGMKFILDLLSVLPIDFVEKFKLVGSIIANSFSIFPAIVIGYQSGVKTGGIVLILIIIVKQIVFLFGGFSFNSLYIELDPNTISMLFGVMAMLFIALRHNNVEEQSSQEAFAAFSNNIVKIKENIIILAISGGIVALATNLLIIAEGPASLILTANGQYFEAALVAFVRTLGFIPLVMTTSIISGVYSPAGTKAVHIPAILLINTGTIGLIGSFVIGALIMVLEILLLDKIAKLMDKLPGIKEMGDSGRSSMSKVIDLSLLIGSILAANAIAPTIGYIWILGLYFLNENARKSLSNTAIGPIGVITIGLFINILYLLGLFSV